MKAIISIKGGEGSGHHGHRGRPGKVGGSLPGRASAVAYDAFPNKEIYNWAVNYLIYNKHLPEHEMRTTVAELPEGKAIYSASAILQRYIREYEADKKGMVIYARTEFIEKPDGSLEYVEHTYNITAKQFMQLYNTVKDIENARLEQVKNIVALPDSYEEFFEGVDITANPWTMPNELKYKNFQLVDSKVQELCDRVDYKAVTSDEISSRIWEDYAEQLNDAGYSTYWATYAGDVARNVMEYKVRHAISAGDITPEEGDALGYFVSKPQGVDWEPLPGVLYHATTNSAAIIADRIRSRRELGQSVGVGLAGGEDDTISFGEDMSIVVNIERSLHEAHAVANGKVTIKDMFQMAIAGAGAKKPYIKDFVYFLLGIDIAIDNVTNIDTLKKYVPRTEYYIDKDSERSSSVADEIASMRWDVYNYYFLKARERAGGYFDPLFFGTDWKALAKLDPDNFATLRYKSKPKSRGYRMPGLSEWRVVGGDVVELDAVLNFYDKDDMETILDWEGYNG